MVSTAQAVLTWNHILTISDFYADGFFQAPEKEFAVIKLPLGEFKPYHRGMELPLQSHPLDISAITNVGLKVDNGQYLPDNNPGVAALEIDWIKATRTSSGGTI